jgi:hypothetical protein
MPINQLQHIVCVASREHHHKCRTDHRCPGKVQTHQETRKDQDEFDANQREQTAIYRSEVITSVAIISTAPNNAAAGRFKGRTLSWRPLLRT